MNGGQLTGVERTAHVFDLPWWFFEQHDVYVALFI